MQNFIKNNDKISANEVTQSPTYQDLMRDWRIESGPQFGIPVDVAPLTGIRLSANYFVDKTGEAV